MKHMRKENGVRELEEQRLFHIRVKKKRKDDDRKA